MAHLVIDDVSYGLAFGSDIVNDGIFLELSDNRLPRGGVVLEAFRSDSTGEVTITALVEKVPFQVISRFLDAVRAEWPAACAPRPG